MTGTWCDFGGKMNEGESDEAAACREFCEESMCVPYIGDQKKKDYSTYYETLLRKLEEKDYYRKICIESSTNQYRVYYVIYIPWQPVASNRFQKARSQLMQLQKRGTVCRGKFTHQPGILGNGAVDPHYLEKCRIQWWSIERISDVIRSRGRFKENKFRRGFLPALEICVNELKKNLYV